MGKAIDLSRVETTAQKFDAIQDAIVRIADGDGYFCGLSSYAEPGRPTGHWQVRIGEVWYDVDVHPSEP